jgi:hypothetical protein
MHHPHIEAYISLYGNPKPEASEKDGEGEEDDAKQTPTAKAALNAERPAMWSVIEKTMEEGPEALKQLRERRFADGSSPTPKKYRVPVKKAVSDNKAQPSRQLNPPQEQQGRTGAGEKTRNQNSEQPAALNRRERRRLMRETVANKSDEDDVGGFFEEM